MICKWFGTLFSFSNILIRVIPKHSFICRAPQHKQIIYLPYCTLVCCQQHVKSYFNKIRTIWLLLTLAMREFRTWQICSNYKTDLPEVHHPLKQPHSKISLGLLKNSPVQRKRERPSLSDGEYLFTYLLSSSIRNRNYIKQMKSSFAWFNIK